MLDFIYTIRKKVSEVQQKVKITHILIKLLPILSFIIPILILYSLYPKSFEGDPSWEGTWQGRFFYLFFLWIISLETILGWENLQTSKLSKLKSIRTIAFIITLLLPTIYMVVANYCGLNTLIVNVAKQSNVHFAHLIPLAAEYLIFAVLFGLMTCLVYGIRGMKDFSISAFFLVIIGVLYIIDDVYPYGRFTPFQNLVPATTGLAANVLNLMGYKTSISFMEDPSYGKMPVLTAWNSQGRMSLPFAIAWPCAGVESLLIYTLTILLFLKNATFLWKNRKVYFAAGAIAIYFAVGAIVTYFVNALRIATIAVTSINGGDWLRVHNIYGPLYSILWITTYPLIIIGSRFLWKKINIGKPSRKDSG